MTPQELSDRIAEVMTEVASWTTDPREWGRGDLDASVEVWARLDQLITDLTILRRDHGLTLARRVGDQETAYTRDGIITVHRDVPRTEQWDGAAVIDALAEPMVSRDGEIVEAIRAETVRSVTPACGPGQTSSRWNITRLRQVIDRPEQHRTIVRGDPVIARGPLPSRVRNARPPTPTDEVSAPPDVQVPSTETQV